MHAVNWPFLLTTWEEFFALDCTCDDITHYRILFRQISCKIHFLPKGQKRLTNEFKKMQIFRINRDNERTLPFVFLLEGKPREAKV